MTERVLDSARADRVAIVRRALNAFLDDDLDAALALASPEIVAVRMPPLPDAQVYRGREGVLEMWSDWTAEFEEFEMTVDALAEVGGRVVGEVIQRGTGRASGVKVEGRFWLVYTLAGSLIVRLEVFASESQARMIAGS